MMHTYGSNCNFKEFHNDQIKLTMYKYGQPKFAEWIKPEKLEERTKNWEDMGYEVRR